MATALTPEQIIEQFETMVGDSLDPYMESLLMNQVKDTIENDDEWAVLKTSDESQTCTSADTYLTFHPLPSDFGVPSNRGIYVGTDVVPYLQVPFDSRLKWKDSTHRYYIDLANNQYALCGSSNPGGTIHFYYQKTSPTLALAVAPASAGTPWIFPNKFHPILPMLMAKKYIAIDQGDKTRSWDDRWDVFATEILEGMRRWNARMITAAFQNDIGQLDWSKDPNIVDMDSGTSGGGAYG